MSDSVPLLHRNQLQVNADIVRRLIDTQFPDGRGLPLRRHPSTGTVNAIYRVGEFSVRLPLLAEFADALTKEVHWLPRLARHLPLACPEVVAVGQPAEEYPHPWAVFRWIDGTPVFETKWPRQTPWRRSSTPSKAPTPAAHPPHDVGARGLRCATETLPYERHSGRLSE